MSLFNNAIIGASGQQGYQISRSVRLRSSASAYFNRTPASAGNRKTWTWSGWVKRGTLGATNRIFTADDGSASTDQDYNTLFFTSSDQIKFAGNLTDFRTTTAVYRDPSAWYHIVFATDTTQATAANRFKLYVNGVEVTAFGTSNNPSQNTDLAVNAAIAHYIGSISPAGASYFDGYQAEINFIDGQALTPTSFGQFNSVTGVWQPIKYTGTYGTNGFYLNFSDNSNNTATTIGKDYSGNGNNWTPNNISVTSGVTYDSMLDVPTMWADGGNGRGNYAVLNPLDYVAAAFSGTASDGNLTVSIPAPASSNGIASSIKVFSTAQSKIYVETTVTALTTFCSLGMISGTNANYRIRHTNDITINVNDVIMTAFDPATGNVWYGRNGTWLSSGNPSAGTNPWATMSAGEIVGSAFSVVATNGSTGTFTTKTTFGQQPFTYTPPSGFVALNTQNLPAPTISNGALYMAATTYTGNGGTQSIANTVNGVSFKPDLVWVKGRSVAYNNYLTDSVRGAGKELSSNLTDAESSFNLVSALNSNGFTVFTNGTYLASNQNGTTYVGWQWQAGQGTTSSNTSGSITSTVSVNATAGFSVVTYTGNATSGATVGHGLGVAPSFIIAKNRSSGVTDWPTYHISTGNTGGCTLNETLAKATTAIWWNNTTPSSTVVTLGSGSQTNGSGNSQVLYCFAAVAGYSAFGSYTGNGSTDGPFVYLGFRPRWLMVKNISTSATDWILLDSARDTYNVTTNFLRPNLSNAEGSGSGMLFLSNGFKWQNDTGTSVNQSGATFIYAAFAENPFKLALAR